MVWADLPHTVLHSVSHIAVEGPPVLLAGGGGGRVGAAAIPPIFCRHSSEVRIQLKCLEVNNIEGNYRKSFNGNSSSLKFHIHFPKLSYLDDKVEYCCFQIHFQPIPKLVKVS